MNVTSIILSFAGSLALSAILTPVVRHFAHRRGWLVRPRGDRWRSEPVPILGGYAIAAAFALAVGIGTPLAPILPLLIGAGLMFGLGALDDGLHFRPSTKLVVQTIIAAVVTFLMPQVPLTGMAPLDALLSVVWFVGITNAFNLLDNIDGLAAGIAVVSGIFFLAVLASIGASPLAAAVAAFAGASLGFLVYNARPASIFMGDSGSLFLGSFLAGAALLVAHELQTDLVPVAAIPLFILLVPITDTTFVSVTRRLAGRSPLHGGRDHLSHRLVALGIDEGRAVLALCLLSAVGGLAALSLQYVNVGYAAILIAVYLILLVGLGIVLGHVQAHTDQNERRLPLLLSELAYQNRTYEVILDLAIVALAYYMAFRLRFQEPEFSHFMTYFAASFPLVLACQMAGLGLSGKYRQVWRSFGARELVGILKGVFFGVAGSSLLLLFLYRFTGFSRLVVAIDGVVLVFLLVGTRLAVASMDEYLKRRRSAGRTVLVYGAGVGGALLVHALVEDRSFGLMPVGFIDDDPTKRRLRLEGVPVVGTFADLDAVLDRMEIAELLVSIKTLDRTRLAEVADICRDHGVSVRSMRFALEEIGPIPAIRHAQGR